MAIFPLDITGTASTNRIVNEIVPIVPGSGDVTGPAPYVLLQYAPFFTNIAIDHNGNTMYRGQHYDFIGQNIHASKYIGKELYAGIYFFNPDITGNIRVSYNTLGDTWVQNNYQHIATFFNTYYHQQMVSWDRVFGVPYQLPPIIHPEPLDSLMGMDDIVAKLEEIKSAIEDTDYSTVTNSINALSSSLTNHASLPNPHGTDKSDIGLGNVNNYSTIDAQSHLFSGTQRYVSGGNSVLWGLVQTAVLQQLPSVVSQNPLSTDEAIFTTTTDFAGITMPDGSSSSDLTRLVIIQIRLPDNNAQRGHQLHTVRRLQLGVGLHTDPSKSVILARELPGEVSTTQTWAVIPSWGLLDPLIQ